MKKLLILVFIGLPFLSWAQDEATSVCVQNIELAQQRYDEGRIQDIQALLKDCIDGGTYDKAQKAQALRLLTLSYLFLEDEENAEAAMLQLISTNHEFQVNAAIDPTEFINLHEQFRYKPLFNVGVRYIFNLSQPIVTELNSSLNLNGSRPEYIPQVSIFSLGVNFEYEFYKDLVLYPEIHFRTMTVYKTYSQNSYLDDPDTGAKDVFLTTNNYDKQSWISLPVSVKYLLHLKKVPKIKFYANLGASMDYLLSSEKPGDNAKLETRNSSDVAITTSSTDDKNRLNFGVFGGGGVTFKIGEGLISLEGRYLYNFNKLQKAENVLLPNDPAALNSLNQEDVYRLNHIAISLGYTHNIYLPKQLR